MTEANGVVQRPAEPLRLDETMAELTSTVAGCLALGIISALMKRGDREAVKIYTNELEAASDLEFQILPDGLLVSVPHDPT